MPKQPPKKTESRCCLNNSNMFILKKDRKLKNVIVVLAIFAATIAIDSFSKFNQGNAQEARFLGIGVKHETMPCIMGVQGTKHTTTILWIKVGDSSYTYDEC
ncbi:hypothetical protein C9994_09005 [Marivirga lumbricoides]|uniref:Uncharacterized protein n=1 Tax=Marivirga lumbricoides TaxID=1046115 RepID=A0A2T4DQI0_9BACT|nr:hypothetical protein C9994_09005 [Marivirga lumbricoides]